MRILSELKQHSKVLLGSRGIRKKATWFFLYQDNPVFHDLVYEQKPGTCSFRLYVGGYALWYGRGCGSATCPHVHMSKCSWARHWTLILLDQHLAAANGVWVCVWMGECKANYKCNRFIWRCLLGCFVTCFPFWMNHDFDQPISLLDPQICMMLFLWFGKCASLTQCTKNYLYIQLNCFAKYTHMKHIAVICSLTFF